MTATTLVIASPAGASCNETCKEEKAEAKTEAKEAAKEKAAVPKWEAKKVGDPWVAGDFGAFRACKYEERAIYETCFSGVTEGGKNGGFFEYGNVKVPLSKSIVLQGTFSGAGSQIQVFPATHGYETLEAPSLPVTGGLKLFTPEIQQEEEWPAALTESWKAAVAAKDPVNVKIEMAGTECFETVGGCLDTENILFEEGTAFNLPLKVKVESPWLEQLESAPCYIGSDEAPIHIHLTTEGQGAAGHLTFNPSFSHTELGGSKLVDVGWKIEEASAPKGCGGAYESVLDKSLSQVLEIHPWRRGIVILKGDLHTGGTDGWSKGDLQEEGELRGELPEEKS